jgi:hypothetical protein
LQPFLRSQPLQYRPTLTHLALLRRVRADCAGGVSGVPFDGIVSARQQKRRRADILQTDAVIGYRRVRYSDNRDSCGVAFGLNSDLAIVRDDAAFDVQLDGGPAKVRQGAKRLQGLPNFLLATKGRCS